MSNLPFRSKTVGSKLIKALSLFRWTRGTSLHVLCHCYKHHQDLQRPHHFFLQYNVDININSIWTLNWFIFIICTELNVICTINNSTERCVYLLALLCGARLSRGLSRLSVISSLLSVVLGPCGAVVRLSRRCGSRGLSCCCGGSSASSCCTWERREASAAASARAILAYLTAEAKICFCPYSISTDRTLYKISQLDSTKSARFVSLHVH